ncbi:alpha/beta hydrolase [Nostocoides sp. Soil756]|jgi:alpha-beta hydrolase superfamily lysophospholipase|uniref:alpha/beta hydrolase n=1 Tax=Nostocoides sp. Soil756 TaxID=1736399 RepID=UPI0006FBF711|nr:alpha/beta hydrolase [Tetrasphaera sp. Soil756]KRE62095.1 alpha/beta hydrolase [Tetrasphaera sp. Soil756]
MQSTTTTVTTADDTSLFTHRWLPDGEPKGVVQIAHGMAEHSARYARVAEALTAAGYAVYAHDHRGHGRTAEAADHGYFADRDGWARVVADLRQVTDHARAEHPGLPVFLLGHSMGSFLARSYVIQDSHDLAGLVLSGTAGDPGALGKVGAGVAAVEARLRGRRHTSSLLDKLTFGQYNAAFKPNRTAFDWLSRDEAEVDAYVADPLCGNTFTSGFFADLLGGLAGINDPQQVAGVRRDLPVLLVSGDRDPVGDGGKGPRAVAQAYREAGLTDVTCTLYPEARHELFNETNRDEVLTDVVTWLDAHLPG